MFMPSVNDIFLDVFGNPIFDLILIIFLLVGVIVGFLFRPKARKEVSKFDLNSKRFMDFNVTEESAVSLECEEQKGMPQQRFYKYHPGFTGVVGRFVKRPAVRFIGRMGTAFTWKLSSESVKIGSLADALKLVWGEPFYNSVPGVQRQAVEESQIGVTIGLDSGEAPQMKDEKGTIRPLTEEDIKIEQDRVASKTWWEGIKAAEKKDWIMTLFIFVAGMGAMAIVSKLLQWW